MNVARNLEIAELDSPVGRLTIAARDGRLVSLCFDGLWPRRLAWLTKRHGDVHCRVTRDPAGIATRLGRYFGGDLDAFAGLEIDLEGTDFQRAVWSELRRIPAGETRSYAELARAIGAPAAVRAVGTANGANPIGIVVPCHRVIGSDGTLTGFAGGLAAKRWLLEHESAQRRLPVGRVAAA
jgi:methylated-DNA-[protein]-cysteine S-methyltransferase